MTTGPPRIAMPSWSRPHSPSESGAPGGEMLARVAVPLLAVVVLASGVATWLSISAGRRSLEKQVTEDLRTAARSARAEVDRYLEARSGESRCSRASRP